VRRLLHVCQQAGRSAVVPAAEGAIGLSARQGEGLDALRSALLQRAGWQATTEGVFIARTRHVLALQRTAGHLRPPPTRPWQARRRPRPAAPRSCGWHTRPWARSRAPSTADDLLGEIFGHFCIGK